MIYIYAIYVIIHYIICDMGLKTRRLSFLAFVFGSILHCICLKILFTEW